MENNEAQLLDTEAQSLNRFPQEPFKDFIKLVFDFLLNPKDSNNILQQLTTFCDAIGASPGPVKNLVKSLIQVLRSAAKRGVTSQLLHEQLSGLGVDEDKVVVITEHWRLGKFASICRSLCGGVFSVNQLVDMEWKFGVTAATSDNNNGGGEVGHSFLQLKLVIDKGNDQEVEDLYMELTLPQFYSFMHEMEKAKAGMELLS